MRAAKAAFSERKVEVNREELVKQLEKNKETHVAEYNEAILVYKSEFRARLDAAFSKAKKSLEENYTNLLKKVSGYTEEDIVNQDDYVTLVNSIQVNMPVPRSYEKEYRAAIDMMKWDINPNIVLTSAEFNCFVRDEWDWKEEFLGVTKLYKN